MRRAWSVRFAAIAIGAPLLSIAAAVAAGDAQGGANAIAARIAWTISGPPGDPFTMPSDAAVGAAGDLYVLDGVKGRVAVFDAAGTFRFAFGRPGSGPAELHFPLGIGTAPDGTVYVADSGNHRVQVFAADGTHRRVLALPAVGSGAAPDPTDVVADAGRDRLYVADNDGHRVLVHRLADLSFEAAWGGPGRGELEYRFPFLLDATVDGYLLVVEAVNTRVQVVNARGKFVSFIGEWGVRPGQVFRPKGVAALGERIFVSDSYLGRVQAYDRTGRFLGALADAGGEAPLSFSGPTGLACDRERKRLYIVELKGNRVSCAELTP